MPTSELGPIGVHQVRLGPPLETAVEASISDQWLVELLLKLTKSGGTRASKPSQSWRMSIFWFNDHRRTDYCMSGDRRRCCRRRGRVGADARYEGHGHVRCGRAHAHAPTPAQTRVRAFERTLTPMRARKTASESERARRRLSGSGGRWGDVQLASNAKDRWHAQLAAKPNSKLFMFDVVSSTKPQPHTSECL